MTLTLYADLAGDPITMTTSLAPSALPLGVQLRRLRPDDLDAVARLQAECHPGEAASAGERVQGLLAGEQGELLPSGTLVAVDEQGQVIAAVQTVQAAAVPGAEPTPFVVNLATQPAWQGRGLARALLVEAMRSAAPLGPRVGARVQQGNEQALSLLRSLGFSERAEVEPPAPPAREGSSALTGGDGTAVP